MTECIACHSKTFSPLYENTLLKCSECGFVTANIDLPEEEFFKLYNDGYFTGNEYSNYVDDAEVLKKNFEVRLKYIFKNSGEHKLKSVLEIGCAYGFFGDLLRKYNVTNYYGVDVSQEAIDYAKNKLGLDVSCEDYLQVKRPGPYSDVFMWDVIEHLSNPHLYLKKIWNETESGARLYITTGNIESKLARMQGKGWRMIHPPTHLHYFSERSITKMLDNQGFKVRTIDYFPVYRSVRQVFYSLFLLNKPFLLNNFFTKKIYDHLLPKHAFFGINTYDIMFVTAEKR